jgi:predicted dehydrogenase
MKTIRWGIIGVGDVTEIKSGPGFQQAEHSRLVAVMRRNGALAEDYAKRHNVPKWYDNAKDLIDDPEVDAVYIATPPAFHKQYAIQAAIAGKPVYVEKPMALNYAECEEMVSVCQQHNVSLFVAYYRRALPRFVKVKELVESGAIGDVRFVSTTLLRKPFDGEELTWRVQPEIAGGGLFIDLASHTLDFFDYLFGPVTEVKGWSANQGNRYSAEDFVAGTYKFASGVYGAGSWSFSSYANMDINHIVGSKGEISFSSFDEKPVVVITGQGSEEFVIAHPQHVQQPLIQTIVNELLGMGTCPSKGISGARTNWVIDEMVKNYYT